MRRLIACFTIPLIFAACATSGGAMADYRPVMEKAVESLQNYIAIRMELDAGENITPEEQAEKQLKLDAIELGFMILVIELNKLNAPTTEVDALVDEMKEVNPTFEIE